MANAVVGKVLLMPKGVYGENTTYEMLDVVRYDNKTWVCKKTSTGNVPQDGDYWQVLAQDGAEGGYCYIRYSEYADGTDFVENPNEETVYIGFYTGDSETAPTNKTEYIWSRYVGINGKNGTDGKDGVDGKDGISASASVAKTGNESIITCQTGNEEPTVASVKDGASFNMAGEWISGYVYTNDGSQIDVVSKSGSSYACLQTHTASSSNQPPNNAYWQLLAQKGGDGIGSGDMLKATYDTDNDGIVDVAETLNGLYASIQELNLLSGARSNIQEQIDGKLDFVSENTAFNKNFEVDSSNIQPNGIQSVGTSENIPRADHVHPLQESVSGNAGTAEKLKTARTIKLSGDVTGSVSFDGSANVTIETTVLDDSHNHVVANVDGLQGILDGKQPRTQDLTAETSIENADIVPFYDSSASTNRKSTWENIKSVLKTYFDTLYNYTLPTASTSTKGGIKVGDGLSVSEETLNASVKGLILSKEDFLTQTESTEKAVDSYVVKELLNGIDGSGGAGNVINVTTLEESLFYMQVTAISEQGEIVSSTFDGEGKATIYAPFIGEIIITSTNGNGEKATRKIISNCFTEYNIELELYVLYGIRINKNEDMDPLTRIERLEMAAEMTPVHMDYSTGKFDYGSWNPDEIFFLKNNYPAMVKFDGTEDYKLDPEDYAKKLDGTASDVSNTSYEGNVMARVDTVWLYQYEDDEWEYCYFCDKQLDDNYHAYAHQREDGSIMDYIWLSCFDGSLISNKVRSIKGQTTMNSQTGTNEITYAQANGSLWYTRTWAQRNLINMLLLLIGCSDDCQTTFGNGHYTGGSQASHMKVTGTLSDKGRFYGTNGTGTAVKVFHIENWWGNQWERIAGLMYVSGTIRTKMVAPYNTTGGGYENTGVTMGGTSGGYCSVTKMTEQGRLPVTMSGSQTTYTCDGVWFNASKVDYVGVGGSCSNGFLCGLSCVLLAAAVSDSGWDVGAALSCEQPLEA